MKAKDIMKILKEELEIYENLTKQAKKETQEDKCTRGLAKNLYERFDGGRVAIAITIDKIKTHENTIKTQAKKH